MTADSGQAGGDTAMGDGVAGGRSVVGDAWGGDVMKSAEDKRFYLTMLLENGMRVILVHDPEIVQGNGNEESGPREEAEGGHGKGCGHDHVEGEQCSGFRDVGEGESAEKDVEEDDEHVGKESAPVAATKKV